MHIHPNNNLQLASLRFARDETWEIQEKAVIAARQKIVQEAVGMVEMSLTELSTS